MLPPPRFSPVGGIEWAIPSREEPQFIKNGRRRSVGKIKQGLDYEKKFEGYMEERFGELYVPGPWIRYKELGQERTKWCQPDGLLFIPLLSRIIILETKLKHTSDAWWQLRQLYLPVVSRMFPPNLWTYSLVEVVQWYDKDTPFQERVRMCPDVLSPEPGEFGVHIWVP